jgi:hypothetical protein
MKFNGRMEKLACEGAWTSKIWHNCNARNPQVNLDQIVLWFAAKVLKMMRSPEAESQKRGGDLSIFGNRRRSTKLARAH